jgi:hypothetical protein
VTAAPRRGTRLVAVALLLPLVALLALLGPAPADAAVRVDPRLTHAQCTLTGRVWVSGAVTGCARYECVAGARIFKAGYNAELCEQSGKHGAEYARPIDSRICAALHRVWIGQINSCASNPDRARETIPNAPQCAGPWSTYVTHSEAEGHYDECMTPGRVGRLRGIARRTKAPFAKVSLTRSAVDCEHNAGHVLQRGLCVVRTGPVPAADLGGLVMIGDSVMWRAENELGARHPDWDTDGIPGRKIGDLQSRLDWYRRDHGNPSQLIVQLGNNATPQFTRNQFDAVIATVPATTSIMLILPYRAAQSEDKDAVSATIRYQRWERSLGASRPNTCVADWPAVAEAHPGNLVDGEHPNDTHEVWYARWVGRAWSDCLTSLGQ